MRPVLTTLLAISLAAPLQAAAAPPDPGHRPEIPASAPFEYVSPLPGSHYHLPQATIILRPGGPIDAHVKLDRRLVTVRGSVSGDHAGRLSLSDDGATLVFEPLEPFAPGEEVTWRLGGGLRTETRGSIQPRQFTFFITGTPEAALRIPASDLLREELGSPGDGGLPETSPPAAGGSRAPGLGASGSELPAIQPLAHGPHSPGYFFLADMNVRNPGHASHLMIVDDDGVPVASHDVAGNALDFKLQPNGWMTYFDASAGCYYALSSSFEVIDQFRSGNGYSTDLHELRLLPDGHALLMAYDPQPVDMSAVVPGGRPDATVVGLIVQELDRAKRVVFQWRSWDHYRITDATHRDFTAAVIDYAHGNSVEKDVDGDLIISARHMDEITKISRRTGEIVWRWGGKNNQFTFVNDPIGFSYQHHARRIANGNVTLFDNGFFHSPPFSRALEYRLDERQKTATLVWEYRPSPPLVAFAMGSVQRLDSGNTVVGWGSLEGTTVTEVTPAGEVVAGLALDRPLISYRSFRFEWPPEGSASAKAEPGPDPGGARKNRPPQPFRVDRVSGAGALPVQIRIGDEASRAYTVSVFDTRGRLVRRWGAHADARGRLSWDGTRAGGGACGSGVYFVRVEDSRGAAALKIVIAR